MVEDPGDHTQARGRLCSWGSGQTMRGMPAAWRELCEMMSPRLTPETATQTASANQPFS